jgi:hypothetical protein
MQPVQSDKNDTAAQPEHIEGRELEETNATEDHTPDKKPSAFRRFWNWLWEKPASPEKDASAPPADELADGTEDTDIVVEELPAPLDAAEEPAPAEPSSAQEPPKPRIILAPAQPEPEPDERTLALLRSMRPWVTIWRQPEETMRQLITLNPPDVVVLLALLDGINTVLDLRFYILPLFSVGWLPSPLLSLLLAFVPGSLLGLLTLYLWSIAVRWAGRQLYSAHVPPAHLRLAIAWSTVPRIAAIPLALPLVLVLLVNHALLSQIVLVVFGIAEVGLFVWAFLLFVRSLSAVYDLSRPKALSVALLGTLAILLPLAFLGLVLYLAAVRSA